MSKEIDLVGTHSTDAYAWASEFIRCKEVNGWSLEDIDKDLMIGWFANAIVVAQESTIKRDYIVGVDLSSGHDSTTFVKQYFGNWDTNAEFIRTCGECEDFGPDGCKSSYIEAKYGNGNTPACEDFKLMLK